MDAILRSVERKPASDGQFYFVIDMEVTDDAGTTLPGRIIIPEETLEWRAAEYGIDPADTDTLLDIAIYEPFLGEPDRPDLTLHNAPTIEAAREYHLGRVRAAKGSAKGTGKASRAPAEASQHDAVREKIKGWSKMNPEAIELKRGVVAKLRGKAGAGRMQMARMAAGEQTDESQAEQQRIEKLRRKLNPPTTGGNTKEMKNGSH